ncbi:kinase-like domain-containing protein [Xylariaceae sp. FL1272]|nr:kinase-like domain-containing protein [Xylariaceae sp. FL1272]
MNNDLSLSRALGGLRIANANPDDGTSSPPPPEPQSHSDLTTTTSSAVQDARPGPDPEFQTRPSRSHTNESVNASLAKVESGTHSSSTTTRNPNSQYSNPSSRPMSSLYNAGPAAPGYDQAASSYHLFRTEPAPAPTYPESGRTAPAVEYAPDIPSRESSHRDRFYNQNRQSPTTSGSGPAPPRRSSKGMGGGYGAIPGVPVAPEPRSRGPELSGSVPGTTGSEEWKDRGAATGMRKEVDANGRTVRKPVKKGVRDFTFGQILGEGSYSTVFLATDRQTLKEYAIKVLEKRHIIKEKKIKYVNIEKDTLNRLTEHPGIVRLYYTFQDENSLYYVLDLCSGGELLGVLKKTGTFDVECTRFFGAQILDAIEYMHSRGVIHRDLKPENVLLDDQLHVKITDFGTARLLSDPRAPQAPPRIEDTGTSSRGRTQDDSRAASFVGTAEYVSPELLTNKNACKASDLWAFGCIIYQLLAGRPPFKGGSEYLTFQKIVSLEYEFPTGFPPAARDLVERCLVLDPALRLTIEHIKNHEFFDNQPFGKNLWKMKTPRLRPYVPPSETRIIQLSGMSGSQQSNANARPQTGGNGMNGGNRTPGRIITDIPPPSQLDIEWSPVLTKTNERILRLGDLMVLSSAISSDEAPRKFARFFGGSTTKKRQRLVLITSSGRIILAPSGGEDKKAKQEISLLAPDCSWKTQTDAKGQAVWCVDSAGYHYTFEELKAPSSLDPPGPSPEDWVESLQRAKDLAVSMNLSGAYASDNGFGDASSMSSPASTFGPEGYGVSDRHRNHMGRSQASLEDPSSNKRHRFSKRQSKQGLGAAF